MDGNPPIDGKPPVAGLSAASSCIRASLCAPNRRETAPPFRPVFTHQSFDKECIAGWRPLLPAERHSRHAYQSWNERSADDAKAGELHPSYQYCTRDQPTEDGRIDIHVRLSPSCEACNIEIQTETCIPTQHEDGSDGIINERAPKKAKTVSFEAVSRDETCEGAQQKQMEIKDIVCNMTSAVPPIASVKVNGTLQHQWLPSPDGATKTDSETYPPADRTIEGGSVSGHFTRPGQLLKTYSRKIKEGSGRCDGDASTKESQFVITMADGADPDVARYHNCVQPLARWFIETADDVDLTDDSRGAWTVMYLFRCHDREGAAASRPPAPAHSLAGYITLLHVYSPFRKPPGIILRVCQALILPPYHRAGHGSTMLHSLHAYYAASSNDPTSAAAFSGREVLEINVEDPAPAFVALRDFVDYQRFSSIAATNSDYLTKYDVTDKEYFLPTSDHNLLSVAQALKITKRQAQIAHEIYKLYQVERWKQQQRQSGDPDEKDQLMRQIETNYRLMVKRSLRSCRMEELGACQGGKEGQKALLGQWFEETLRHYRGLLGFKS